MQLNINFYLYFCGTALSLQISQIYALHISFALSPCTRSVHARFACPYVRECLSVYILSAFVCVQLCFSTHTNTADIVVVVTVDVAAQPVYFAF